MSDPSRRRDRPTPTLIVRAGEEAAFRFQEFCMAINRDTRTPGRTYDDAV
jgi:hypothetical protein